MPIDDNTNSPRGPIAETNSQEGVSEIFVGRSEYDQALLELESRLESEGRSAADRDKSLSRTIEESNQLAALAVGHYLTHS